LCRDEAGSFQVHLQRFRLLFQLRLSRPYCGLLISAVIIITLSLLATPYDGSILRPRYLFEAAGLCFVLIAICIVRLPVWLKINFDVALPISHLRIFLYLLITALFFTAIPYRINNKLKHARHNSAVYYRLLSEVSKPALVFLPCSRKYCGFNQLFNPPSDSSSIIVALDRGEKDQNQKLMDMYPNRFVYKLKRRSFSLSRLPVISGADGPIK
jgi:hypothetical protein